MSDKAVLNELEGFRVLSQTTEDISGFLNWVHETITYTLLVSGMDNSQHQSIFESIIHAAAVSRRAAKAVTGTTAFIDEPDLVAIFKSLMAWQVGAWQRAEQARAEAAANPGLKLVEG